MTLVEAVLAVLLAWPPFGAEPDPETSGERQIRLTQAAIAITDAAVTRSSTWSPPKVAAAMLALGHRESRFAQYVAEGQCMRGPVGAQCDPHRGKARARTYWQQHYRACPAAWREPRGSMAETRAAAQCAASLLQGGIHRCRTRASSPEAAAFAAYAGIDCARRIGPRRAALMLRIESRLRQLLSSPAVQQPVSPAHLDLLPQQPEQPSPLGPRRLRVLALYPDARR